MHAEPTEISQRQSCAPFSQNNNNARVFNITPIRGTAQHPAWHSHNYIQATSQYGLLGLALLSSVLTVRQYACKATPVGNPSSPRADLLWHPGAKARWSITLRYLSSPAELPSEEFFRRAGFYTCPKGSRFLHTIDIYIYIYIYIYILIHFPNKKRKYGFGKIPSLWMVGP